MDSPIKWMGGKSKMRDEIIRLIPAHKTYCEVFGGAAWILFGKPASPIEFLNDIDGRLTNLYIVLKNNLDEFQNFMDDLPISEQLFNDFAAGRERYTFGDHGESDIIRACETYYIIMNSFNGNISGSPSFAISADRRSSWNRFNSTDWNAIKERLKSVTIFNRDYSDAIKRTDSMTSFYYLDPPYIVASDSTRYYRYTFVIAEHKKLHDCLKNIDGKFLLSYGNDDMIKELYSDFIIKKSQTSENELLIMNYEASDVPFYSGLIGIPSGYRSISWKDGNCPFCGSRNIKYLYERKSLDGGKRTFIATDMKCKDCFQSWNKK